MSRLHYDENEDLSKFLESVLPQLYEQKVNSLAIIANLDNGDTGSAYFNCNMSTKLLFAGLINQDAMMDTLIANSYIEDEDFSDDDDEDDDDS